MGRDFLAFWRLDTLDAALRAGKALDYAASNQYARVQPGDTVWVVSVRGGRLRLVGRVAVDQVVDHDTAAQAVGSAGLWQADRYILPPAGTARPVADIDIHHLVPDLQFEGSSDRLTPDEDGLVSGQQLQAMRRLAGDSPRLLAEALGQ
ncbi:MAG TPA: hypothetical protein PKD86_17005 [Gemmatales bacterium]|nr:hypothetical protein [Gemmatales bacterium]